MEKTYSVTVTENQLKTIIHGIRFAIKAEDPRIGMQCMDLSNALLDAHFKGVDFENTVPTIEEKYNARLEKTLAALEFILGDILTDKDDAKEKVKAGLSIVRGDKK